MKPASKSSFLDRVLGRIGRLDAEGLQTVIQRLARERSFLETLFNTIEDGVLVVDERGRILYFNQAVTRLSLAPGLVISATSPDGFVEGLESPGHYWVVGVQWHPERPEPAIAGFAASSSALFAAFANAVGERMGGGVQSPRA